MQTALEKNKITSAEIAASPLETKIWRESEEVVNDKIGQSYGILRSKSLQINAGNLVSVAFVLEAAELADNEEVDSWTTSQLSAHQIALLHLEMPAMIQAQQKLDHAEAAGVPREQRLGYKKTLSQFNRDLAEVMTFLPPGMVGTFANQFFNKAERIQRNLFPETAMSKRQFFQRIAGVKREVAFGRALRDTLPDNWHVRHTSVEEDLAGSDFVITDNTAGELHIDTKSKISFENALLRLEQDGKITYSEYQQALAQGYYKRNLFLANQHKSNDHYIINADSFGNISNFEYDNAENVYKLIDQLMTAKRDRLLELGKSAIVSLPR